MIVKGVPQGSILGPLLSILYNFYSPTQTCNAHFYADDTILYVVSPTTNHHNLCSRLILNSKNQMCAFHTHFAANIPNLVCALNGGLINTVLLLLIKGK